MELKILPLGERSRAPPVYQWQYFEGAMLEGRCGGARVRRTTKLSAEKHSPRPVQHAFATTAQGACPDSVQNHEPLRKKLSRNKVCIQ